MEQLLDIPADLLITSIALLDSLPDYIRAMLSGLLLAVFLKFWEARIPANEVQFSASYRKTALAALILIPLMVWLFPSSRLVVFVEELPEPVSASQWGWLVVLGIWALGFLLSLARLAGGYLQTLSTFAELREIPPDDKLTSRLQHWQRRLGMPQLFTLVEIDGEQPGHLIGTGRIAFPGAALHWPASVQDILLINELCRLKKHHGRWDLFARFVACCYWPVTWVPKLHERLRGNFQIAADGLSRSCYQDHIGYGRALRQIEQRSAPAQQRRQRQNDEASPGRLAAPFAYYRDRMARTFSAQPDLYGGGEGLLAKPPENDQLLKDEPYDKVFWFIGQAVFLAFLFTGVTLKQAPPELDRDYSLPFEFLWMENFHRNLERIEQRKFPSDQDPPSHDGPAG